RALTWPEPRLPGLPPSLPEAPLRGSAWGWATRQAQAFAAAAHLPFQQAKPPVAPPANQRAQALAQRWNPLRTALMWKPQTPPVVLDAFSPQSGIAARASGPRRWPQRI